MIRAVSRRLAAILTATLLAFATLAQAGNNPPSEEKKPYRILTSGRQVTVKSTRNIRHLMIWTASGHRVVELRDLNSTSYSFQATMKEKIYFIMIQYEGRKPYTEKIGVK